MYLQTQDLKQSVPVDGQSTSRRQAVSPHALISTSNVVAVIKFMVLVQYSLQN